MKLNFGWLFSSICCIALGIFTLTGYVQSYITFNNPLGELTFSVLFLMLGIFSIAASIELECKSKQ